MSAAELSEAEMYMDIGGLCLQRTLAHIVRGGHGRTFFSAKVFLVESAADPIGNSRTFLDPIGSEVYPRRTKSAKFCTNAPYHILMYYILT